jgi:alpha-L-fucosidase 2
MYTLPGSINYVATAQFTTLGPNASVEVNPSNSLEITVLDADEVLIVIAIDTNYIRYDDLSGDPAKNVSDTIAAVGNKTFDDLLVTHIADHSALFGRVNITLGTRIR